MFGPNSDPRLPMSSIPGLDAGTAPNSAPPRSKPALGALRLVLPGDSEGRRESRRTSVALVALIGLGFVLLNFVIYHSARSRLASERWNQLVASTEEKRGDLDELLAGLQRDAKFVADQVEIRAWVEESRGHPGAKPPLARSLELERRLDQAASSFDLLAIEMVAPDGTVFANSSNAALWRTPEAMSLARRVSKSGTPATEMDHSLAHGKPLILVAAPAGRAGAAGGSAVAVVYAGLEDRFRASLDDWVVSSPTAGAFVVMRDDNDVVIASRPPLGIGLYLGQRIPIASPQTRALAIAAQGGESQIEGRDASGRLTWWVTRRLPKLSCGLVGRVDRSTMLVGMRVTLLGLLLLDVGVGLLALTVILLWRRQFRAQVAEREMTITRRHAERLQAVLDSAFDAILSLDPGGRVLTANRAAVRLFGRNTRELTGRPMGDMLAWDGRLPRAPHTGQTTRSVAKRPDGVDVAVEYTLAHSREDEAELYTLVVRDVSARVEAEDKVHTFARGLEVSNRRLEEANRQLEQSSRLKSEFLANTSHELRTPLNGIMGFLQLVLDGLCDSPEEERDFQQQALHCSKHLIGLINDVLDIAKIEAGRLTLCIEPIEVGALFDEVYTVTHVQAQQKGLRLTFEPPPAGNLPVRGDFGKVKQVLINLVGNSLKFTPSGSIVVRAQTREDAGHVLFEVVDTGIGIPPDRQKQIFEKFTQADGSTTRRYGGTGLGLAITRSLVELMGGVIDAESEGQGKGTRMSFSLPVWRGDENLPSDAGEAPLTEVIQGPAGGTLVLVVDDDSVYRRLVVALLHENGYRTAEATHAEAGWILVRRLRPSLVLLDYALSCPEGALLRTGWDLAERMNGDERTRHIPFLFVTGYEAQLGERLRSAAFARQPMHVSKPVKAPALIESITAMLGDSTGKIVRVLLADDDPMVAAYVSKVLPAAQFHLEVVNNGEECLHLLRTQPKGFDLLLLDLMMPDTSGFDVLREMALRGTAASMPVIVLTAHPDMANPEEQRLLDHGLVLEVLPKTAIHERPRRLTEAIEAHLASIPRRGREAAQRMAVERADDGSARAEVAERRAA